MDYTQPIPSPELFKKWTAIVTIAAALERKVWVYTYNSNLYPNLYTFLVAPPGVGKSIVTDISKTLLEKLPTHYLAPSSVTKASLIDTLQDANRVIQLPKETPSSITFQYLTVISNELGVLIPSYESVFMTALTDIYDGKGYSERRRGNDLNIQLNNPQLTILAATQPSYLTSLLPEGAWDQGFLSRVLLIYSGDQLKRQLFTDERNDETKFKALVHDLKQIGKLFGKIMFTEEAKNAMEAWHADNGPPRPDHPKLKHYLIRRSANLLKLCMIFSVARSNELIVTIEDYSRALAALLEAEHYMPDVFKAMGSGGDTKVIEECWYFCAKLYTKKQKPVEEFKLMQFLQERTPAHNVERILAVMISAKLLKVVVGKGGKCYRPLEKMIY